MQVSAKHCSGKGLAVGLFTKIELDLGLDHIVSWRSLNLSSGCIIGDLAIPFLFYFSSDLMKRNITTDANHADCLAKRICTDIEHNSEDTDLIFVFAEREAKIVRSFTRQHLRQALEEP